MYKVIVNKFSNNDTKQLMMDKFLKYKEQKCSFNNIKDELELQKQTLLKLKADLEADTNNPYVDELTEAIDAKIKILTLKEGK